MARLTQTITQGSADAFVQATMVTALEGSTRQAYKVLEISVERSNTWVANGLEWELAISRRTKSAMPEISDVDVIKKFKIGTALSTSGAIITEGISIYRPEQDVVIVEDPLYIQLDSNATGVANSAVVVIEYEIVTISEIDRLTLLTQSLV